MPKIRISSTRGRCRWCRCTHDRPCANGCAWADRRQTLCTECVPLEASIRSVAGRRELAEFLQEHQFMNTRTLTHRRVTRR